MNIVFKLLACYYAIGIVAVAFLNARSLHAARRERWVKLATYIGITLSLLLSLAFAPVVAWCAAVAIALIGAWELGRLPGLQNRELWTGLGVYGVVAVAFCAFVAGAFSGPRPFGVYFIVLTFDGFSQIAGQLFGGPKVAPRISPGKTWSGLAGGLLMGVATAALLEGRLTPALVLSALTICLLAFAGDMLASAIKRRAGVKDFSRLIPGHGGVLDRFDSFLLTGAALETYFRLA